MSEYFCGFKPEVRQTAGNGPVVAGYAAVYYRAGDPSTEFRPPSRPEFVERVNRGAFDGALGGERDVVALAHHDRGAPLGRRSAGTLRLTGDEIGLRYEIDVPDTSAGRDLIENVARGEINGASVGFHVPEGGDRVGREGGDIVRWLDQIDLYELSPVTIPAYDGTSAALMVRDEHGAGELLERIAAGAAAARRRRARAVQLTIGGRQG